MKSTKVPFWAMAFATLLSSLMLTACNTVEGVGRDVEEVGDAIEDAADND
jgi:predicted small secreted protein